VRGGTVVLAPFPFTDLPGSKVRPGVVVSRSDRPGEDVILTSVSSVVPLRLVPTDLFVDPSHPSFHETGLKVPSLVKCDKLASVQRRLILGELGQLPTSVLRELDQCLRHALDL